MQVVAPVSGTVQDVQDVPDPVFASGMVGPGLAIEPRPGVQTAVAPIAGRLAKLHPHAFLVVSETGPGVLVHLGIDTVQMHGDGFNLVAAENDVVRVGQEVVTWDPAYVVSTGRSAVCAVVVLDCPAVSHPLQGPGSVVTAADPIFDISC
ncbi:PTS glucose transporter subunit IIA [soil metagenome]